jgi:cytochrome c oxidase subunit 2
MRSKVTVQEQGEYQAWLEQQRTFAELTGQSRIVKATYKTGGK